MEKPSKISTNRLQYGRMVELLLQNPGIAQGFTKSPKEEVNAFWEQLKTELNSLGPPSKDTSSWKKVWLDWKAYIKRKLSENKKECKGTGGGPFRMHSFSSLEETVIKLTGLETSTAGIKGTSTFGLQSSSTVVDNTEEPELGENSEEADDPPDVSMSSNRGISMRRNSTSTTQRTDTVSLLKEQIKLQKDFYSKTEAFRQNVSKNHEEISSSLRRINRGIEKMCELQKKSIEETHRHNKMQEELLQRKIEIKLKMLELEEIRLN